MKNPMNRIEYCLFVLSITTTEFDYDASDECTVISSSIHPYEVIHRAFVTTPLHDVGRGCLRTGLHASIRGRGKELIGIEATRIGWRNSESRP